MGNISLLSLFDMKYIKAPHQCIAKEDHRHLKYTGKDNWY